MKNWKITFYILGLSPWAFIISLMSFYIHARIILGYFPHYNFPDPKILEIYSYYSPFILWTFGIWAISLIIWILLTSIYFIIKRKNIQWKLVIISVLGYILGILLFFSNIMIWFVD